MKKVTNKFALGLCTASLIFNALAMPCVSAQEPSIYVCSNAEEELFSAGSDSSGTKDSVSADAATDSSNSDYEDSEDRPGYSSSLVSDDAASSTGDSENTDAASDSSSSDYEDSEGRPDDGSSLVSDDAAGPASSGDSESTEAASDSSSSDAASGSSSGEDRKDLLMSTVSGSIATSGTCGLNATWSYAPATHVLTISGSGEMYCYSAGNPAPWDKYSNEITTIIVGSGITIIGDYAFYKCTLASRISLPDTVKIIGNYSFAFVASDQSLSNADTHLNFPKNLERICEKSFWRAKYLKMKVSDLPASLVSVGFDAFYGASNLTGIFTMKDKLVELGDSSFRETGISGKLTINNNITSIPGYCFFGTKITSLVLGSKVSGIGYDAFCGCTDLDLGNLVLPDSIQSLGASCFEGSKIKSITFGKNVKYISNISRGFVGNQANVPSPLTLYFKGDFPTFRSELLFDGYEVTAFYPGNNKTWTKEAMDEVSPKFYYVKWWKEGQTPVPDTSDVTFSYNPNTTTLTLSGKGDMLDYLESKPAPWAQYADTTTKIIIGDDITSIGSFAFNRFTKVKEITLGKSIRQIKKCAFSHSYIEAITFPAALEELNITALCIPRLNTITFLGDAPKLSTAAYSGISFSTGVVAYYDPGRNGWTEKYIKDFNDIYPGYDHSFYFTPIGSSDSDKCGENAKWAVTQSTTDSKYLKLTISGTGSTYDYSYAKSAPWCRYIEKINEIEIKEGITGIGAYSFTGFPSTVKKVSLPGTLKTIGNHAFQESCNFAALSFPKNMSLEVVDDYAFDHCAMNTQGMSDAIKNAHYIGRFAFYIVRHMGFEDLYLNAKTIGDCAFDDVDTLKSVTFGDNVEVIDDSAFSHDSNIQKITFGKNIRKIGGSAFKGAKVETFTIPDSVTECGSSICPTVTKALYVGKNITDALSIKDAAVKDIDIYFSGNFPANLKSLASSRYNFYYPRYNLTWLNGIDSLGSTVATFIPLGEDKEIYCTVKFNTGCNTKIPDQKIPFGERIIQPTLSNGDKVFLGWFEDPALKKAFDFSTRIGADMTLYAGWKASSSDTPNDWGDIIDKDKKSKGFITPADVPAGIWYVAESKDLASDGSFTYNGLARTYSSLRVYYNTSLLTAGKDYTLRYYNNVKAGKGYVLLTFKGNYSGSKRIDFTIKPSKLFAHINQSNFSSEGVTYTSSLEPEIVVAYTGKVIKTKPRFKVTKNGKALTLRENVDYTIVYDLSNYDYKSEGEHVVKVQGKGNYSSECSFTFKEVIVKKPLMSKATVSKIADRTYTGSKITIDDLKVKYGKKLLIPGKDYEVKYSNNKLPGTATIELTGIGDYAGKKNVTFKIKGMPIKNCVITGFDTSQIYDHDGNWQNIAIYKDQEAADTKNKNGLVSTSDYTVTYLNNTKPGTATMVVTGCHLYEGTIKKTYKITGYNMAKCKVEGLHNVTYTGEETDPRNSGFIKVSCSGKTLDKYDYSCELSNNINAGSGKLILKGLRGCYGTKIVAFRIAPFEVTKENSYITIDKSIPSNEKRILVKLNEAYQCTKKNTRPVPDIFFITGKNIWKKLTPGTDFTVSYKNNVKPGTGMMTITFKGNYKGTLTTPFTILASDIKNCSATATNVAAKNAPGLNVPRITVTDQNGVRLVAGTDYDKKIKYTYATRTVVHRYEDARKKIVSKDGITVSAGTEINSSDIIPAGTEIIATISGAGLYYGKTPITCRFRVTSLKLASATVTFKQTFTYTGKEIKPGYNDMTVKIGKTVLSADDFEIVSYKNNVNTGVATITLKGKGRVDGTKAVTFKIVQNKKL